MLVSTRPLLNLILKPSEPPSPSGGDTSQLVVRWDEFFIRVLRCGEELLAIPVVRGTKTKEVAGVLNPYAVRLRPFLALTTQRR